MWLWLKLFNSVFMCTLGWGVCDGRETGVYEEEAWHTLHSGSGIFSSCFSWALHLHPLWLWVVSHTHTYAYVYTHGNPSSCFSNGGNEWQWLLRIKGLSVACREQKLQGSNQLYRLIKWHLNVKKHHFFPSFVRVFFSEQFMTLLQSLH